MFAPPVKNTSDTIIVAGLEGLKVNPFPTVPGSTEVTVTTVPFTEATTVADRFAFITVARFVAVAESDPPIKKSVLNAGIFLAVKAVASMVNVSPSTGVFIVTVAFAYGVTTPARSVKVIEIAAGPVVLPLRLPH